MSQDRQVMQMAVPLLLPMFYVGSLVSLLKLDHPVLAYSLSPLLLVGVLALGYCFRVAARAAAAASRRLVPRWIYGLAALCFLALIVVFARLAYAESHASDTEVASITLGFVAFYCAIGGVLLLGRALVRGPRRTAFWVFLPHWLDSAR
jgi:hypothetical protein